MEYVVYSYQGFLLIMTRVVTLFAVAPFFSSGVIPNRAKAMLGFLTAIVIFPVVAAKGLKIPGNAGEYYILVLQQAGIGIFLGFLVTIVFTAFQLAGQYFAVQIGFGISEVLDPLAQVSIPVVGQLKNLIGLLVFLAINGHHQLIHGIYRSFELAPFMSIGTRASGGYLAVIADTFSGMFIVAFKIALPVVGTAFLISVSMGILAKVAPQMNIMMLGFPFQIVVAFGLLMVMMPMIVRIIRVALERTFETMNAFMAGWPG